MKKKQIKKYNSYVTFVTFWVESRIENIKYINIMIGRKR